MLDNEGEPVMAIALPERINRFDIDPDKGIIYGIDGNYNLRMFRYTPEP